MIMCSSLHAPFSPTLEQPKAYETLAALVAKTNLFQVPREDATSAKVSSCRTHHGEFGNPKVHDVQANTVALEDFALLAGLRTMRRPMAFSTGTYVDNHVGCDV